MALCNHNYQKDRRDVLVCTKCGYRPVQMSAQRLAEWIVAGQWRNVAIVGGDCSHYTQDLLEQLQGVTGLNVRQVDRPLQWHDLIVYVGMRKVSDYRLLRDQIAIEVALG